MAGSQSCVQPAPETRSRYCVHIWIRCKRVYFLWHEEERNIKLQELEFSKKKRRKLAEGGELQERAQRHACASVSASTVRACTAQGRRGRKGSWEGSRSKSHKLERRQVSTRSAAMETLTHCLIHPTYLVSGSRREQHMWCHPRPYRRPSSQSTNVRPGYVRVIQFEPLWTQQWWKN